MTQLLCMGRRDYCMGRRDSRLLSISQTVLVGRGQEVPSALAIN